MSLLSLIPFLIKSCIITHVMQSWHTITQPLNHGVTIILSSVMLLAKAVLIYSLALAGMKRIYWINVFPLNAMMTFRASLKVFSSNYPWLTLLTANIIGLVLSLSALVVSNMSFSNVNAYCFISFLNATPLVWFFNLLITSIVISNQYSDYPVCE